MLPLPSLKWSEKVEDRCNPVLQHRSDGFSEIMVTIGAFLCFGLAFVLAIAFGV